MSILSWPLTPAQHHGETPQVPLDALKGNSDALEALVVEMYARGLSTRDIEDACKC